MTAAPNGDEAEAGHDHGHDGAFRPRSELKLFLLSEVDYWRAAVQIETTPQG